MRKVTHLACGRKKTSVILGLRTQSAPDKRMVGKWGRSSHRTSCPLTAVACSCPPDGSHRAAGFERRVEIQASGQLNHIRQTGWQVGLAIRVVSPSNNVRGIPDSWRLIVGRRALTGKCPVGRKPKLTGAQTQQFADALLAGPAPKDTRPACGRCHASWELSFEATSTLRRVWRRPSVVAACHTRLNFVLNFTL
jgi:hypothetical protein